MTGLWADTGWKFIIRALASAAALTVVGVWHGGGWEIAVAVPVIALFVLWEWGTFTRPAGCHREGAIDWDAPAPGPLAIMAAPVKTPEVTFVPARHSPDWPMTDRTEVIGRLGDDDWLLREIGAAIVTDEPPALPAVRVYEFRPGVESCGRCGGQSHHTGGHDRWAAMAAASPQRYTPEQRAETVPQIGRPPAWVTAPGLLGHETVDALVDSMCRRYGLGMQP